jgi:hypothetical protein
LIKVRKTYREVNPELLYAEIRDFAAKQGVAIGTARMDTYTLPDQSASFISRGTIIFLAGDGKSLEQECIRAHIVGSVRTDTKMMLDIDERLFPAEKIAALQEDIDFIFGEHEVGRGPEED